MTASMLKKLDDHLWYLSERLVVLTLFSDKLSVHEKQAKATALLRYKRKDVSFSNERLLPVVGETITQLKDLDGVDSWQHFNLLNLVVSFQHKPARLWLDDSEYQNDRKKIQCLSVANDSAERALGLVSEFLSNKITKNNLQKQCLYQVVMSLRSQQTRLEGNWSDSSNMAVLSKML